MGSRDGFPVPPWPVPGPGWQSSVPDLQGGSTLGAGAGAAAYRLNGTPFAEGDAVKFVERGLMEAFTDTIGVRALGLGACVIGCPQPRDTARTRAVRGCRRTRYHGQSARAEA